MIRRRLDSLTLQHQFHLDVLDLASRYSGSLPQEWEDALHNVLDVIERKHA